MEGGGGGEGSCSSPPPPTEEVYRECLRNHAASLGSYATDGCGEFTLDDDTAPGELKCAACGCHRNFHRKVNVVVSSSFIGGGGGGGGGGGEMIRYDVGLLNNNTMDWNEETTDRSGGGTKKRIRSKFTVEQKQKMLGFAEKIGWKMRRSDDDEIERFCRGVGVSRQVFKVWMHNHKSNSSSSTTTTTTTTTNNNTNPTAGNASSLTDQ